MPLVMLPIAFHRVNPLERNTIWATLRVPGETANRLTGNCERLPHVRTKHV